MGRISNEIRFDYPAPTADDIVKEVSKLTGLPVILLEPYCNEAEVDEDEEQDAGHELYEFIHRIAFKDFPETMFDIYAYIPNAVNDWVEKEKQETGFDANWPRPSHGADEEKGKQSIYIEGYLGMETTLFSSVRESLMSLGGIPRYEGRYTKCLSDYPISKSELASNIKKIKRKNLLSLIITIVLIPVLLPLTLIRAVFEIIKMPFSFHKTYKAVKEHYPEHFKDKK